MMGDLGEAIVRAFESLEHAATVETVWSVMKAIAANFGFDRMLVLKEREDPAQDGEVVVYDDMASGVAQAFDRGAAWRSDPLVRLAFADGKPFMIGEVPTTSRHSDQLRSLLGATDGLIVPIEFGRELKGVMVFAGPAPDASPIARSALHLLAHRALHRMLALDKEPKRKAVTLSPREAECLRWAAAGKTDNEIGAILSISPRTARFHIENAKKKLGVSTRIQAVTEALRLKAIAA